MTVSAPPFPRRPATWQRGAGGRAEIHCAACRYGAVVARLPERCPMCGSPNWRRADALERVH